MRLGAARFDRVDLRLLRRSQLLGVLRFDRSGLRPGALQRCLDQGLRIGLLRVSRFCGGLLRQPFGLLAFVALDAFEAEAVALPRGVCGGALLFARRRLLRQRQHADAIHRAGRDAQFAAGAQRCDDGVHQLGCAGNRIHRAGLCAQRAADAEIFVDERDRRGLEHDVYAERLECDAEQIRQLADAFLAAGRTLVDVRLMVGDGLGVRPATGIAALAALRLRQDGIDLVRYR